MGREGEEAHAEISEGFETIETPLQLLHAPVAEALTPLKQSWETDHQSDSPYLCVLNFSLSHTFFPSY